MKLNQLAFAATLLIATSTAFAAPADTAVYVGAGIGQSRLHSNDVDSFATSSDLKDRAGKVFVGKQLNRNFGVEASYFDLGDFSASAPGLKGNASARGLGLDLVTTLPLTERFAVLGRVGVTRQRLEGDINGFGGRVNKTNPKAGIGFQYKLTENLAARGEFETYRTNADIGGYKARSHVNVVGASLAYNFGRPAVKTVAYVAPAPAPVYVAPTPAPVAEVPAPTPAPTVVTKKVRQ
jgi:OOP family OmpA-OmpF porin